MKHIILVNSLGETGQIAGATDDVTTDAHSQLMRDHNTTPPFKFFVKF